MPIDFERVPPKVPMPPPPRPSIILWAILLVVIVGIGAGLTATLWPKGMPSNTLWFWCCAVFFPALTWILLLSVSLGIGYARRSEAMATNLASARIEQERHKQASLPLMVLGHAWCFSAQDEDNSAERVANDGLQLGTRLSAAQPGTDIRARWLEVPDMLFYAGNARVEHDRHQAVCNWLLGRLIDRIGGGLAALPAHTVLHVDLCAQSLMKSADVQVRLQELILAKAPTLQVKINTSANHFSLFRTDDWHDQIKSREARLILAVQLRKAVSELLRDGDAETGAALLVAQPGTVRNSPPLRLHRPAKGKADGKHDAFDLAVRWGGANAAQIHTIWSHALPEDLMRSVKSLPQFSQDARWVDVGASVGDCDSAGAWLATALAFEHARLTSSPQLVLSQQGDELIALVCKKST